MPQQKHISIVQNFGARTWKVQRKMLRAHYLPLFPASSDLPLANYCIPTVGKGSGARDYVHTWSAMDTGKASQMITIN